MVVRIGKKHGRQEFLTKQDARNQILKFRPQEQNRNQKEDQDVIPVQGTDRVTASTGGAD